MAEFNPVPQFGNVPDFTNAPGRLIDQSGLGELFGNLAVSASKAATDYMDQNATNDITNTANKAWEDATVKDAADKAGLPVEVAKGMDRIKLLQQAIAKGGVSQTNAYAQMNVEMKRLQAKYPQRSNEIQQAYARATGNTAANDLYNSMASDWTTLTKAAKDSADDTQKRFDKYHSWMSPEEQNTFFKADSATQNQIVISAARRESTDQQNTARKNQLALDEANRKDVTDTSKPAFVADVDHHIATMFRGDMTKVINYYKTAMSDNNLDANEKQQLVSMVQNTKMSLDQSFEGLLMEPFGPGEQKTTWNQLLSTDPSIIQGQRERISGYKTQLDNLLKNDQGTGVLEYTAAQLKMADEDRKVSFMKTEAGMQAAQIKAITDTYGPAGQKWIEENFGAILDEKGDSSLATVIGGYIKGQSLVPGATLGSVTDQAKPDKSEAGATNAAIRSTVEAHLKTLTDPNADGKLWEQSANFLYSPENQNFFAKLSTVENQYGVSQQELAFQKFTDPKVAAAFKAHGREKQWADAVIAWSQPVYGSLPEDIRGRAGVFLGSGNVGNKRATATFNPETMQVEFRVDPSKVKDTTAVAKFINGNKDVVPDSVIAQMGINPSEAYDLRATAKAVQRINIIMKAQKDALKSQGMSNDRILQYLQMQIGDLAPGKDDPFISKLGPMIGEYVLDVVTGKKATETSRALAQGLQDQAYGTDFGQNPDGSGTPLNVIDTGSSKAALTQPNTGDSTADTVLSFIHSAEGADYNTVFGGGKVNADSMTVQDVLDRKDNAGSSAFGANQVMKATLKDLVDRGVVRSDQVMNQTTQDTIGLALLKQAGYDDWQSGKLKTETFADRLAGIWASLPLASGKSKYESDGVNKATVSREELLTQLYALK